MSKPYPDLATPEIAGSFGALRIFLCGASGTLGGELARQLARPGVRMTLWARDLTRLDAVAGECRATGAMVTTRSIDICDVAAAVSALAKEDARDPFDLALLVSGQGDTLTAGRIVEDPAQIERIGIINFVAPAALAAEIAERMARRGHGQIGLVGTAAAAHSLPFAAAYCGSKAGLGRFADALRVAVKVHGVSVTLVSPGFFAPDEKAIGYRSRPGEIPASIVAARMIEAVMQGRAELITPRTFVLLGLFGRLLPRFLRDRLLRSLPPP